MASSSKYIEENKNESLTEKEMVPVDDEIPDLQSLFDSVRHNVIKERRIKKRKIMDQREAIAELFRQFEKENETIYIENHIKKLKLT